MGIAGILAIAVPLLLKPGTDAFNEQRNDIGKRGDGEGGGKEREAERRKVYSHACAHACAMPLLTAAIITQLEGLSIEPIGPLVSMSFVCVCV